MRVAVAGASGFLGSAATRRLLADGHRVVALSRDPARHVWPGGVEPLAWDGKGPLGLEGPIDAVVGLTGEPVGQRWSDRVVARLRASRIGVTQALVAWMAARPAGERPKAFVSASAVGYYGLAPKGPQEESLPAGHDFLAQLCHDWEDAAVAAEPLGVRVVRLRFGIVLGPEGGALKRMLPPFRLGLGGPIGSGRQPFSWVHRDDAAAAVAWAVMERRARGPYNVAAPQATDMRGFARTVAATVHRPAFFRVPPFALRTAFGKGAAEVLLGGQDAPPDRILKAGFRFQHPDLSPALAGLLAAPHASANA